MTIERYERIRDVTGPGASALLTADLERSLPWWAAEEGRISPEHHYLVARGPDGTATALAACHPLPHTAAHRAYAVLELLLGAPTEALVRRLAPGPARSVAARTLARLRAQLPAAATDVLAVVTPGSVQPGVLTAPAPGPRRLGASRPRRADPSPGPAAQPCADRAGSGPAGPLGVPGPAAPTDLEDLVTAVERLAGKLSLPVVEFANVRAEPGDAALHRTLRARGYAPVITGADAVLEAHHTDLDAYFAGFRSNRRKVLRKERSRFLAAGPTLDLQGPEGLTADLVALQLARYRAYGHDATPDSVRDRFARAARVPGLRVLRADGPTGPLGFVAFYEHLGRRRLVPRLGAFVRSAPACYFNLAYYELIAHAARLGGMSIHYGDATYAAKTGRGCRLVRLTTYLRATDPALQRVLREAARLRTELEERELRAAEEAGAGPAPGTAPTTRAHRERSGASGS